MINKIKEMIKKISSEYNDEIVEQYAKQMSELFTEEEEQKAIDEMQKQYEMNKDFYDKKNHDTTPHD